MTPPTPQRMARKAGAAMVVTAMVMTACGADAEPAPSEDALPISLVVPTWAATGPEEDPFATLVGRASNQCSAWQPVVEGSILEFSTRGCDAMTVEAPLGVALPAGTTLHLSTTHAILTADAPTTGRLGLAIGERVLVAREVPIPSPANAYADTVTLPADVTAADPLRLHVSNHGPNSWRFVALRAVLP